MFYNYYLKKFINSFNKGVLIVDNDGKIIKSNKYCETLFGYNTEELLNQNIEILVPDNIKSRHRGLVKSIDFSKRGSIMGVNRFVRGITKTNKTIPLDININSIKIKNQDFVFVLIQLYILQNIDIDYKILYNLSNDIFTIIDFKGIIKMVNDKFIQQFEYCEYDILNKNIVKIMSRDIDKQNFHSMIFDINNGIEKINNMKYKCITSKNKEITTEWKILIYQQQIYINMLKDFDKYI